MTAAAHSIDAPAYTVEPHGDDDSIIARALAILAARITAGPLMGSPRAVREYLTGVPREQLEAEARQFAEIMAPRLLRPDAVRTWRRWDQRRAKLVIVTASPDIVVAPFARGLGADLLIGTELAFDEHDRVAGGFVGANCRGPEKVRRLQAVFGPDIHLAAAYGDTSGDREMLAIADEAGYQVFKEKP